MTLKRSRSRKSTASARVVSRCACESATVTRSLNSRRFGSVGQRVVVGEVLDLLLGVRPLGDVADDADHAAAVDRGERDLLREA